MRNDKLERALNFVESLMVRPGDKLYYFDPEGKTGSKSISSDENILLFEHGREFMVTDMKILDRDNNVLRYIDFGHDHSFNNLDLDKIANIQVYVDGFPIALDTDNFSKSIKESPTYFTSPEDLEALVDDGHDYDLFKTLIPDSGLFDLTIAEYINFHQFLIDTMKPPTYEDIAEYMDEMYDDSDLESDDEDFGLEENMQNTELFAPGYDTPELVPPEDHDSELYTIGILNEDDLTSIYENTIMDSVGIEFLNDKGEIDMSKAHPERLGQREDLEKPIDTYEAEFPQYYQEEGTHLEDFLEEEDDSETAVFYSLRDIYESLQDQYQKKIEFVSYMSSMYSVETIGDIRNLLMTRKVPEETIVRFTRSGHLTDTVFEEPVFEKYSVLFEHDNNTIYEK